MEISLSTATINAYENTKKSMNLHFRPIVLFSNSWPFHASDLKNIIWEIYADSIGKHIFSIENSCDSPFEVKNDRSYIEFHLTKDNVPFQYDSCECRITFKATLDSPHASPIDIEKQFWGVVNPKWSKGLR